MPGIDIWYKTYKVRNDTRESYQFSVDGKNVTDPLNPQTHRFPDDPDIGFTGWVSSVLELPDAPSQTWSIPPAGVSTGQVTPHRLRSDILPDWNNFLAGARYMRDVLRAKSYAVHYSEFNGGHNPMNWQGTLATALLTLLE